MSDVKVVTCLLKRLFWEQREQQSERMDGWTDEGMEG